jgi:hypothetical protein
MPSIEKTHHLAAQVKDMMTLQEAKDAAMTEVLKMCLRHLKPAEKWESVDEIKVYATERQLLISALEVWVNQVPNSVRANTND